LRLKTRWLQTRNCLSQQTETCTLEQSELSLQESN
jgi:hypothetical protein